MKITIETNGKYENTLIKFNDENLLLPKIEIKDFHISIHPQGKVKLKLVKYNSETGKYDFISMYGDDFANYDMLNNLTKENKNGYTIKERTDNDGKRI